VLQITAVNTTCGSTVFNSGEYNVRIDSFQNTPDYSGEYNVRIDSFQSTPDIYSGGIIQRADRQISV
jgi:hypothetical protein